jgi:hypothetical protein
MHSQQNKNLTEVFLCPNTFHKTYEARLLLFLNSKLIWKEFYYRLQQFAKDHTTLRFVVYFNNQTKSTPIFRWRQQELPNINTDGAPCVNGVLRRIKQVL